MDRNFSRALRSFFNPKAADRKTPPARAVRQQEGVPLANSAAS
jgi:hypothetical protein